MVERLLLLIYGKSLTAEVSKGHHMPESGWYRVSMISITLFCVAHTFPHNRGMLRRSNRCVDMMIRTWIFLSRDNRVSYSVLGITKISEY